MKKKYEKPLVLIEDFSLSTDIAGSCEVKINNPSSGNCAYIPDRTTFNIFTEELADICTTIEADGEYNSICYHVPYGDNLFNS